MKRRLLNLVTMASLLLVAATVVMWVRSHYRYDRVERVTYSFDEDRSRGVALWSAAGDVALRVDDRLHPPVAWVGVRRYAWPTPRRWKTDEMSGELAPRTTIAGLAVVCYHSGPTLSGAEVREWMIVVPWWMSAVLFGILPASRLARRVMRGRTVPAGHCRRCGYDLTANVSGNCPECGTMAPATPSP